MAIFKQIACRGTILQKRLKTTAINVRYFTISPQYSQCITYSNFPVNLATWIWAVCANLAIMLCALHKKRIVTYYRRLVYASAKMKTLTCCCWSLGLKFRDWLLHWLKLTNFFGKAHSIYFYQGPANTFGATPKISSEFSRPKHFMSIYIIFVEHFEHIYFHAYICILCVYV